MTNPYYQATGSPATGSSGSSAVIRSEYAAIEAGFDLLPSLTANRAVIINALGTAMTVTAGSFALAGNFATTGAFNTTLIQQASVSLTLPLTSDTLVGLATTDTLTNKTISGSANTITNINMASAVTGTLAVANGGTGVTSSTGTGSVVLSTTPSLVTPVLGVASATTINKVTITTPASGATLTIVDGKTLTQSKTMQFTAADDTGVYTFPTGAKTLVATDVTTLSSLVSVGAISTGTWNATTIAVAHGGTGATTASITSFNNITGYSAGGATGTTSTNLVFSTSPTLVTPVLGAATATSLAIGGATLGANAFAVTGIAAISGGIAPRVGTVSDASTITPAGDTSDQYNVTALGQAATIAVPSGTPVNGQKLIIRIKDNGTARALTWTTTSGGYRIIGTALPTTTTISKTMYIGCIFNNADNFWDVVAVGSESA